jgi:hypothetical protein
MLRAILLNDLRGVGFGGKNIKLDWRGSPGTNALAYLSLERETKGKKVLSLNIKDRERVANDFNYKAFTVVAKALLQ